MGRVRQRAGGDVDLAVDGAAGAARQRDRVRIGVGRAGADFRAGVAIGRAQLRGDVHAVINGGEDRGERGLGGSVRYRGDRGLGVGDVLLNCH